MDDFRHNANQSALQKCWRSPLERYRKVCCIAIWFCSLSLFKTCACFIKILIALASWLIWLCARKSFTLISQNNSIQLWHSLRSAHISHFGWCAFFFVCSAAAYVNIACINGECWMVNGCTANGIRCVSFAHLRCLHFNWIIICPLSHSLFLIRLR